MNDAINKLLASTGEPAPADMPAQPAPARAASTPAASNEASDDDLPRKKIIQPITDPKDKPDLNKLLAAEEAKSNPPLPELPPRVAKPAEKPVDDEEAVKKLIDRPEESAPEPPASPAPAAPATPAAPAAPKSTVFDPNNISL